MHYMKSVGSAKVSLKGNVYQNIYMRNNKSLISMTWTSTLTNQKKRKVKSKKKLMNKQNRI